MHPLIAVKAVTAARRVTHNRKFRLTVAGLAVLPLVVVGCMAAPLVMTVPMPPTTTLPAPVGAGPGSVPAVAWQAIVRASIGSTVQGGCHVPAAMLGGVMWAESGFGTHGGSQADDQGDVRPPIYGPALAPGSGFAEIPNDSYGLTLGVTGGWAMAVGPTQFLPSTWRVFGRDGNGDGRADPQNLYDAAAATAAYLCGHGYQENNPDAVRRALLAYNPSDAYVTQVLDYAQAILAAQAVSAVVVAVFDGDLTTVGGITVAATIAPQVGALLAAAAADGIGFGGYGWRSIETQRDLRSSNGCPDIDQAPASSCRVPTAIPGTSLHERGLAVDFFADGATLTAGSRGFAWLQANAARFGLHNLPSEPWHFSTTGG